MRVDLFSVQFYINVLYEQVLDVGGKEDHVTHPTAETKKYRQALLNIEKVHPGSNGQVVCVYPR